MTLHKEVILSNRDVELVFAFKAMSKSKVSNSTKIEVDRGLCFFPTRGTHKFVHVQTSILQGNRVKDQEHQPSSQ